VFGSREKEKKEIRTREKGEKLPFSSVWSNKELE
jgi:hypothetical protein